jgi:hypothetical protein
MSLPSLKGEADFGTPEKGSAPAGNDDEDGGWTTVTRKISRSHREHSRSSRGSRDSDPSESGNSDTESTIAQATNKLSAEDALTLARQYEAYTTQLHEGAGGKTAPLTRRPLTVANLSPLVVESIDDVDEKAVSNTLDLFHAVLYVSSRDNCIYTFHKSFTDFVLDHNRSPEQAAIATSYFPKRTLECFHIMNKLLKFNMYNLTSSFLLDDEDAGLSERVDTRIGPQLLYACQHWAEHLACVRHEFLEEVKQLLPLLLDFAQSRVLFWMETMNLLKLDCRLSIHLARTWALQVCTYTVISI